MSPQTPDNEYAAPQEAGGRVLSLFLGLSDSLYLRALRYGVMLAMPLFLAAAAAILVNNFPLDIYQEFMLRTFGAEWKKPAELIFNCTINILALAVAFSLSDSLIGLHNEKHPESPINSSVGVLICFACLFIMIGPGLTEMHREHLSETVLAVPWAGLKGLFGTFIVVPIATSLFLFLARIRAFRMQFHSEDADPVLPQIFDALIPGMLTLVFFLILRFTLAHYGIDSLHETLYTALRKPFEGAQNSFGMGALYTFLVQACWFFGIHGPDLLDPITHDIFAAAQEANVMAVNMGLAPPYVLTKSLFDVFLYMGGSGVGLSLIAAVRLQSQDSGSRRIAAISLLPAIFNINELLIFGLPVVFNPVYLIPFVLVPLVLLVISYLAVLYGLVPPPIYNVHWTTPAVISGWLVSGSWRGAALQIFNLSLATFMYIPFVRMANAEKRRSRHLAFTKLIKVAESGTKGPAGKFCMDRPGAIGALARSLANDLIFALDRDDGELCLHYQPRVNLVDKTVPGVEALLRWHHPDYGRIPTPLTLAVAEDADLTRRLDDLITTHILRRMESWRSMGINPVVALNISFNQLTDKRFPERLEALFHRHGVPPGNLMLEVPESLALDPEARYLPALEALHKIGVRICVDDFGRGYQALSHLRRIPLSELQVDKALVRDVTNNKVCQDVIGAIQELCLELNIKTTAEHVEVREQLDTLLELNFSTFQGHLFSTALPPDECADFIRNFGKDTGQNG